MQNFQLFSRRNSSRKVDFRPDPVEGSPSAQLRRLASLLQNNTAPAGDIDGCDDGVDYLREFVYRKIFTGTTHEQFLETDKNDPKAIDWLIAVAGVESAHFQARTRK